MVKMSSGWKLIQSLAQNVEYKLRKIKAVIIWIVQNVNIHIVGYAMDLGLNMVAQQVDGTLVIYSMILRKMIKIFRHSIRLWKKQKMSSRDIHSILKDTKTIIDQKKFVLNKK